METVMLLPAGGMTRRLWLPQAEALAGRFTVLTPDLPGHGDVPGPFTMDRAVAEVGRQLDGVSGQVHVCGLSLSATVAVLCCLARPERVRSLVLSGGIAHAPPALSIQRAVMAALPEGLIVRLLARQIGQAGAGLPAAERAAMVAGGFADFRAIGKRTYLDALRELAGTDLRGRLPEVKVPTLVLCGARDRVNLAGARDLAAGIPGAQLRIIPDARHLWNLEHPELFTRTLGDFIDTVSAGP